MLFGKYSHTHYRGFACALFKGRKSSTAVAHYLELAPARGREGQALRSGFANRMGKKKGKARGAGVQHRDAFMRMNFLYQVLRCFFFVKVLCKVNNGCRLLCATYNNVCSLHVLLQYVTKCVMKRDDVSFPIGCILDSLGDS